MGLATSSGDLVFRCLTVLESGEVRMFLETDKQKRYGGRGHAGNTRRPGNRVGSNLDQFLTNLRR